MRLPSAVKGKNKIRDSKILSLYAEGYSQDEIGKRFDISATRVGVIVYRNSELLKFDKQHEKNKRVNHLKRLLRKHPENIGNKCTLDIIDQVRNEIDGKDGSSDGLGRSDTRVIIIRESVPEPQPTNRIADGDTDQSRDVSRQISVLRV